MGKEDAPLLTDRIRDDHLIAKLQFERIGDDLGRNFEELLGKSEKFVAW